MTEAPKSKGETMDWTGMTEVGSIDKAFGRSKSGTTVESRRKRGVCVMITLIGVITLIITLALGLTLGVNKDGGDDDKQDSENGNDNGDSQVSMSPRPHERNPQPPPANNEGDTNCGDATAVCSFVDTFSSWNRSRWNAVDGIANGAAFGSWWDRNQVKISKNKGLTLTLVRNSHLGKAYGSGQLQSNVWFEYGCFEASIKAVSKIGTKYDRLISAFFLYTGEYDAAEGAPKSHNELDVEFVWGLKGHKTGSNVDMNRTIVQTNYFTDGARGNKEGYTPPFDVSEEYYRYGIKWTSRGVSWYVGGMEIRNVNDGSTPVLEQSGPLKLFANLWSVADNNPDAQDWAGGPYVHDDQNVPKTSFQWIAYSKGEDCQMSLSDTHHTEQRRRRRRR